MTSTRQRQFVLALMLLGLCGCQIAKRAEPVPETLTRARMLSAEPPTPPGPVGLLSTDTQSAVVLVDNSTNREVLVKVKDMLGNVVGRWVMDKEVYGNSVLLIPGYAPMGEAPDRPRSHYMFTQKRIPMGAK